MGWRRSWPSGDAAADILGEVRWSPDYVASQRPLQPFTDLVVPSPEADLEAHISTIAQMIRDLRPGQSVTVTYHGEGRVQVTLTEPTEDPT